MYVTRAKIASILKIIERMQTLSASRTIFIVRANFNIIVKCETLNVEACYADEVVTRERRRGRDSGRSGGKKLATAVSGTAAGACRSLGSVVVKLITPRNCLN